MSIDIDGAKLREAREYALLSRRELADLSGVSMDTIERLERGEGGTFGRTVRKLAEALGRPPQEFLASGKVPAR